MKLDIKATKEADISDIVRRSPVAFVPGAEQTLAHCLEISTKVWLANIDGKVACVWGIISPSVLSNRAYLWLLTTDLADKHTFLLVRNSQRIIEGLLKQYDTIYGHCNIDQPRSIRWIKWLGGKFGDVEGKIVPFRIWR